MTTAPNTRVLRKRSLGPALRRLHLALKQNGCTSADGRDYTCPAHDDSKASLSVAEGEVGAVLHCHAGCSTEDVLKKLGITIADLFHEPSRRRKRQKAQIPNTTSQSPKVRILGDASKAQRRALKAAARVMKRRTLSQVRAKRVRYRNKSWLGIPTVSKGWKLWGVSTAGRIRRDKSGRMVRLNIGPASFVVPRVRPRNRPILYDVEGESDLLRLLDFGVKNVLCSTTGAVGTAAYENEKEFLRSLCPREVALVRDLDPPGERGMERATEKWHGLGIPTRQVRLPESLGRGGDVRDFLNHYQSADALEMLVAAAPIVYPQSEAVQNILAFCRTGSEIRDLMNTPEPESPLPGYFDPDPHLHALIGKPKTAKTTLALNLARSWAAGIPPWPMAKPLPGTRVLVFSGEQPTQRVARMLKRLDEHAPVHASPDYLERVAIFGADQVDPVARQALQLNEELGLPALRGALEDSDEPFGLAVVDSLSRVKPPEVEENDNDAMTRWLNLLEQTALEYRCYILIVHHVGHADRDDPRSAARGASAIAAVCSGLWLLKRDPANPRQRLLSVAGAWIGDETHRFRVCDADEAAWKVNYFRPALPGDGLDPASALQRGERINSGQLDVRILGKRRNTDPNNLNRQQRDAARQIRLAWESEGLIRSEHGPHNSRLWMLTDDEPEHH